MKERKSSEILYAVVGLSILGPGAGALVGLIYGRAALGAGLGLAAAVACALIVYVYTKKGVLYDRTVRPTLSGGPGASRNHIICIDGTWNHPGMPTNVRKLFDLLWPEAEGVRVKAGTAPDGTAQLAKYYRGVGARENIGVAYDFLGKRYSKTKVAGITGLGVRSILAQAYVDFVEDYRPGDRIFLFGFSRGATIARMLANYIAKTHGLPESVEIEYQSSRLRRNPLVHGLNVEASTRHGLPEIELLGLWDSVAALRLQGADLTLPDRVENVCHLVAIDEVRQEFDATLFDHDDRVEEIWMPGAHTNVGGGWEEDSRLSDLALRLMLDRARRHGVVFTRQAEEVDGSFDGPIWEAGAIWLRRIRREIVVRRAGPETLPKIHPAAFRRIDAGLPGPDGEPYDPANLKALDASREELEYRPTDGGPSERSAAGR